MRIPPGSLFKIGEVDSQPLQYFCWLLKLEVEKSIDITLPGLGCCAAIQIHLRKALEIQKDAPVLFNNLAVALSMQGKHDEAGAIAEQIPTRFPDYFFGQVITVRKAIQANDLDTAKTILDKMMEKRELHATEFGALCGCQIDYMIESDKPEGAISWFEMWERGYPDDPQLKDYEHKIAMIDALPKLEAGFPRSRRKSKKRLN